MKRQYKLNELRPAYRSYAIKMQLKHTFKGKGLTEKQVAEKIANWLFNYDGTIYTALS